MEFNVEIAPNKDTNALITPYDNSPDFGYIQLKSVEMIVDGPWVRTSGRTALLKAEVKQLELFIKHFAKNNMLPGKIVVREFTENEIPDEFRKRISDKMEYEKAIAQYIKRTGKTADGKPGLELCLDGERILRFTDYVMNPTEKDVDIIIQHDNGDEVKAWRASNTNKKAELPKGKPAGKPAPAGDTAPADDDMPF